jgi:hypothetical protein
MYKVKTINELKLIVTQELFKIPCECMNRYRLFKIIR